MAGSFGTNMMEAAFIAVSGKGRILTHEELARCWISSDWNLS